jgi:hypothetical protein
LKTGIRLMTRIEELDTWRIGSQNVFGAHDFNTGCQATDFNPLIRDGKFSEPFGAVRPKKLPKITVVGARKVLHRNNSEDTAAISVGAHAGKRQQSASPNGPARSGTFSLPARVAANMREQCRSLVTFC